MKGGRREIGGGQRGDDARGRLLAALPVTDRVVPLAGTSTAILEGGDGPPLVLLHEQGEFAARWLRVLPGLVTTHSVIAPDLPGHGGSEAPEEGLDANWMLEWLDQLVEGLCGKPPILVGHMVGGALAARYAARHPDRVAGLVLIDTLGLRRMRPSPRLLAALLRYLARPTPLSYGGLLARCTVDLDRIVEEMGERWDPFETYVLQGARRPAVKAALPKLMRTLGLPAIPDGELRAITAPTTLIWGRHDPATPLRAAQRASATYGWPLDVIDGAGDDPVLEQPQEVVRSLRKAIAYTADARRRMA